MAGIKLRNAIKSKKIISYENKPALWATKCDYCGLIFKMNKYCNDRFCPGVLHGTFSKCAGDLGNTFCASVCSLYCADKIFKGGWEKIPGYEPYKEIKAILIRVEIGLTSLIKTEEELIKDWENR